MRRRFENINQIEMSYLARIREKIHPGNRSFFEIQHSIREKSQ